MNKLLHILHLLRWRLSTNKKRVVLARKMGVRAGENCEIFGDVQLGSEPYLIELGNNVRVTSNVKFVTHDGGLWVIRNLYGIKNIDSFGKIVVGNNVHIGWNTVIMPGVTIGDNCVIGVGAVVTKNIPSNSVAVGVPARVIETIDEYYNKSKDTYVDTYGMSKDEKEIALRKLIK